METSGEALLTDAEWEALDHIGKAYQVIVNRVIGHGDTRDQDISELEFHVHGVQRLITSQCAARRYPGQFRLKGLTVEQTRRILLEED